MSSSSFRIASYVSRAGASISIAAGSLAMVGWSLDLGALKTILPGLPPMVPNTAVGLILAGVSLTFRGDKRTHQRKILYVARIAAVFVVLLGVLTVYEYVSKKDLGMDRMILPKSAVLVSRFPGRPSPQTSTAFAITGMALLFLEVDGLIGLSSQILAVAAATIAMVALLGYWFRVAAFYAISTTTGMAVHTAIAFLALSAGILCVHPEHGVARTLFSETSGGRLWRWMLPAILIFPALIGYLRYWGERAGLYESQTGVALMVVATILTLAAFAWLTARSLDQVDEQFRAVADTASDAVISANSKGVITYFNRAAENMFGYSFKEVRGRPLTLLMPERFHQPHHDGFGRFLATGQSRLMGRTTELAAKRKDGSEFPVGLSLASWHVGDNVNVTGIMRDMTERKRTEEKAIALNQELEQSNVELLAVNKELESFSYSVSHDLRAPLRAIDGFTAAVLEDCQDKLDEEAKADLGRVRSATARMSELIDDLLKMARTARREIVHEEMDLSPIAQEIVSGLQASSPSRKMIFIVGSDLTVIGDRALLRIVLENLLGNAWKFTSKSNTARIEIGRRGFHGEAVFFVSDNGAGFDMRYADKLFGAFQRLHDESEFPGTGVGLATVQRIVHRHGGRIWAESSPGQGATFYFVLKTTRERSSAAVARS